jgi:hypothetical protein
MPLDEAFFDPDRDPEQTAIILDRLAKELAHASVSNPAILPELEDDAHRFLFSIEVWLARQSGALAAAARNGQTADITALAGELRSLAEQLFDLADHESPSNHGGKAK